MVKIEVGLVAVRLLAVRSIRVDDSTSKASTTKKFHGGTINRD